MPHKVISLDSMVRGAEPNEASLIRDAILEAMPDGCRGCEQALDRSYKVGQFALRRGFSPYEAANTAWGKPGFCCGNAVEVE